MRPLLMLPALCAAGALLAGCSSAAVRSPTPVMRQSTTQGQSTPVSTQTTDKATPNPNKAPAFSISGHTEHGDEVHVEGRFGPILPPSESDVDQTALKSCPDADDGRELVRRLDITTTITSSLPGEVRVGSFVARLEEEESQSAHILLDYVLDSPEASGCYRDSGENEGGGIVNLGTLQPHEPHRFTMWVVLPDAITPSDLHPSAKKLASEGWYMGYPTVSVNSASALQGDGNMSVVE